MTQPSHPGFVPSAAYLCWLDKLALANERAHPSETEPERASKRRADATPVTERCGQPPRWLAPPLPKWARGGMPPT